MMIPNEPVLYPNFISEDERIALKIYAMHLLNTNQLYQNTAGKNRFYTSYFHVYELQNIHKSLYDKVVTTLGLQEPTIDPNLGIVISVIKPGGFIQNHTDKYANAPSNQFTQYSHMRNVRFNVMVGRGDDISYDPHIDNKPFPVNLRDGWCFGASEISHSTPKITGPEYRIVYQFGFMMNAI